MRFEIRIGKSVTSDVKECKATLLISYAQKKGTMLQKKILEKNYGNLKVSQKGIEEVSRVFRETGALKYAHDQVDKYFAKAETALKGVEEPLLYSLVDFLRERDK